MVPTIDNGTRVALFNMESRATESRGREIGKNMITACTCLVANGCICRLDWLIALTPAVSEIDWSVRLWELPSSWAKVWHTATTSQTFYLSTNEQSWTSCHVLVSESMLQSEHAIAAVESRLLRR